MIRMPFRSVVALTATTAGLLLFATGAEAGISSIHAHGATFSQGDTIPVFVESSVTGAVAGPWENSILIKGEFMDLATGVESSDSSFRVRTGRRFRGSNSALEILVGAGSAPDQDDSTIHIKFVSGEETFRIKSFKTRVGALYIHGQEGKTAPTCQVGENVSIMVHGEGMANLVIGAAGTMLDVANNRYDLGTKLPSTIPDAARFGLKCTAEGWFMVDRTWFKDSRLSSPAGDAMVRGSATPLTVTVAPAPPPIKVKQQDMKPVLKPVIPPLKK